MLFTVALAIIALNDKRLIAARWAALGFGIACISIIVDGYREPGGDRWVSWFTVVTHFLPLLVMVQAFLSRNARNVPLFAIILTMFACAYVMPNMVWAPPYWLRGVMVQAVCAIIIASGLSLLWSYRKHSIVDLIAFYVVLGAACSYAGRMIVLTLNPIGPTQSEVVEFYQGLNVIFHSASALMGMSVGIVLIMAIGNDMVRSRKAEGEIDHLTKLGNRRRLERQIEEDDAGKRPVGAVLMVDLDHFKRVNDTYGHDAGDIVLRAVGEKLRSLFKDFGFVCRTGGEEFVILVDQKHAAGIAALGLSARKGIASLRFNSPISDLRITASVGYHNRERDETIKEAIQCADQAVYCAKNDGRDRVVGAVKENGLRVLKAVA